MNAHWFRCAVVLGLISSFGSAQDLQSRPAEIKVAPGKLPNAHTLYKELRNVTLAPELYAVKDLVLKRDAGTFRFKSGTFQFTAPVNGRVTGAVFTGEGEFELVPTFDTERRGIFLLTKATTLNEKFSSLVIRFTDETFAEIKKAATGAAPAAPGTGDFEEIRGALKNRIKYNLAARLLMDVITGKSGRYFIAFIKGKVYNGKELFMVDPYGATAMSFNGSGYFDYAPEEVAFSTWDDNKFGAWFVAHLEHEYKDGTATGTQKNAPIDMLHHKLDSQIEKSGKLNGDATTTFAANVEGLQVVPLDLFESLRVQSVTAQDGTALDFIQETVMMMPSFL
jgi:hypothetical protein